MYGATPAYLTSIVPPFLRDEAATSGFRQACNIRTVACRTQKYKESYFPSAILLWNSLPADSKKIQVLSAFKLEINNLFMPKKPPAYYGHGARSSSISHR